MGAEETQFLERYVRPDWLIADVGANQGLYTLFLSRLAASGRVYAFEPDPTLFASLKENVNRNGSSNTTLFNAAAARQVAKLRLRPGPLNRGDNRIISGPSSGDGTIEVAAVPLDETIPGPRLDLLKLDVQGFEVEVLRGAERLLEVNSGLLILLEFWPHGLRLANSDPTELISLLTVGGFSLFRTKGAADLEPFEYREKDWHRPGQFCNLIAARVQSHPELKTSKVGPA
jgi:FkbM family methyltransferase